MCSKVAKSARSAEILSTEFVGSKVAKLSEKVCQQAQNGIYICACCTPDNPEAWELNGGFFRRVCDSSVLFDRWSII